jgi:hypothetical protein
MANTVLSFYCSNGLLINNINKIRDSIDTFMVASVKFQAKEKRNMYNESSLLWFGM